MIDVRVRHQDLLHLQAVVLDSAVDMAYLVAGVDHDGLARFLIAEQRAIALQWSNRKCFQDHATILERFAGHIPGTECELPAYHLPERYAYEIPSSSRAGLA